MGGVGAAMHATWREPPGSRVRNAAKFSGRQERKQNCCVFFLPSLIPAFLRLLFLNSSSRANKGVRATTHSMPRGLKRRFVNGF